MWRPPTETQCNGIGCEEILADGRILEWTGATCVAGVANQVFTFPFPFPSLAEGVTGTFGSGIPTSMPVTLGAQPLNNDEFAVTCAVAPSNDGTTLGIQIFAWGA